MRFSRTIIRNFFTYFLIFSLPVIILVFFTYTLLIRSFQSTTYELELSYQSGYLAVFEQNIERLEMIAAQINVSQKELKHDIPSRMELISQLRYYKALNNTVDDIILYFRGSELIYSSQSTYTPATFDLIFGSELSDTLSSMSEEEWRAKGLAPITLDGKLYFAASYPIYSIYPEGYIIFTVYSDRFMPFSRSDCALFYQNMCLLNHTEQPAEQFFSIIKENVPVKLQPPYCYLFSNSSDNGYHLITVFNDTQYFGEYHQAKNLFTLTSIVICALSMLFLSYFTYRSYRPYRDLQQALYKTGLITGSPSAKTEIYQAIWTLDILTQHNHLLDEQLIQEQYITRSLLLNRLLNNQYNNLDKLLGNLETYGVILDSPYYTACIFHLSNSIPVSFYLDRSLFYSAYSEFSVYCTLENDLRINAVIGSDQAKNTALEPLIREMLNRLNKEGILAEAYVGSSISDRTDIHISYIEALFDYDYHIPPENKIHYYRQNSGISPAILYPQAEINRMRAAIAQENMPAASQALTCICSQLLSETHTYSAIRTICYETFQIVYESINAGDTRDFKTIDHHLTELSSIRNAQDAIAFLHRISGLLTDSESHKEPSESCSNLKIERIQAYIMDHFTEPDFYLGAVADHFGLSPNNLSQQFKRYLGISPAKYITVLKIDRAKELLIKSELSVKEIAVQIGYSDASTFVKNFKNITSLTPNQYRNDMRL